jgi:general secretion pathway protein D
LFSQAAGVLQKQLPGLNLLIGSDTRPEVIISALNNITNVQVLSSPSLVMVENQTASLQVGDEVPVTTRQAQSIDLPNAPIVNQVEFRETGIILRVTPRIGQNDAVTMQIEQEISSVVGGSETLTPTISKRKVASNISVVSGQTVLLAGLISEKREKRKNGIPGLIELPGLGDLFSTTNNGSGRTEIVVFIRPVVVRSGEDAQTVAEEFRSRLRLLGSQSSPGSNRTFKR